MEKRGNRAHLVAQGYIIEPPLIKRLHNEYRKDFILTQDQKAMLKKEYGINCNKDTTEKEVLKTLRKRFKHYKFVMDKPVIHVNPNNV